MSNSNKSYMKRGPKSMGHLKGLPPYVNPACCGITCCGYNGKSLKRAIRLFRRLEKKKSIREGLE